MLFHAKTRVSLKYFVTDCRPKFVPESKVLRIYWNLAYLRFQISQFWFKCWNNLWNIYHLLGKRLNMLRIYWNLAHLIFQIYRSLFLCLKQFPSNIFINFQFLSNLNTFWVFFHFGTNLGLAIDKYLIKNNFWYQNQNRDIRNIKCVKFQ